MKRLRTAPRLKHTKFRDKNGRGIPLSEYHHKAAEYLAEEQWKRPDRLPPPKINPSVLTNGQFHIDDSEFTLLELNAVIGKQQNNKSPGTDNLRAERVKHLMKKTGVLFWNSSMAFFILVSWKILCMKPQLFLSSRKEIPVNWRTIVQYHYCRRLLNYLRL